MLSAFGISQKGSGSHKENQDTYFLNPHNRLFGVFDGHGARGLLVSEAVRGIFAAKTSISESDFTEADDDLRSIVGSFPRAGGTTASVLSVGEDGSCTVHHVGDSEVRFYDSVTGERGAPLTEDHSATSVAEFLRYRTLKNRVDPEFTGSGFGGWRPVFIPTDDSWILNPRGGYACSTVRNDYQAYVVGPHADYLAMTRVLGDFNMKKMEGVIATPSVCRTEGSRDRVVVMASDGLWDGSTYEEIGRIVMNPDTIGKAEVAANELLALALANNARIFGSDCDDVTILVVYIKMIE